MILTIPLRVFVLGCVEYYSITTSSSTAIGRFCMLFCAAASVVQRVLDAHGGRAVFTVSPNERRSGSMCC